MRKGFPMAFRGAASAMAALLSGACSPHSPADEVLAVVNGQTLTQRDLNTDIAAAKLPVGSDLSSLKPILLNDLINRKLIVQQAKKLGLDDSQDYRSLANRADDIVLSQQLIDEWTRNVKMPTVGEAQAFIARNPQAFSNRVSYTLDEVQTPSDGLAIEALEPLHSMDAVLAYLRDQNRPVRRENGTLDTAAISPVTAQHIAQLPPGEPFVSKDKKIVVISVITRSTATPVQDDQQIGMAFHILERANIRRVVNSALGQLRANAAISYKLGTSNDHASL